MKPAGEGDARAAWKAALSSTPGCIPIERLGGALSPVDSAHLAGCPRCQAELALWREFDASIPAAEEGAAVAWIAQELRRRSTSEPLPAWWRRRPRFAVRRLSGALAAIVLLAGGMTLYTLRSRTGAVPNMAGEGVLRSQGVVLISPLGDLDSVPAELRWQPVSSAANYQVQIMEVDRHDLWESKTVQTRIAIPDNVRARIAPGKTLLWEVTVRTGSGEILASSGPQKFKVKVKKTSGEEL